jgi:hypothetical protein
MRNFSMALTILTLCFAHSAQAESTRGPEISSLLPPLVPSPNEVRLLAVPALPIHEQLDQCLEAARRFLDMAEYSLLHVRVGPPYISLNPSWGYLLRADFTRDDVSPPSVNRIVCWQSGQIIASKLAVLPLGPGGEPPPLAVPGARGH